MMKKEYLSQVYFEDFPNLFHTAVVDIENSRYDFLRQPLKVCNIYHRGWDTLNESIVYNIYECSVPKLKSVLHVIVPSYHIDINDEFRFNLSSNGIDVYARFKRMIVYPIHISQSHDSYDSLIFASYAELEYNVSH